MARWAVRSVRSATYGIAALVGLVISAPRAFAETLEPKWDDSIAINGLDTPVAVRFSPDGDVFVAEKAGLVKRFAPLPSPGTGTVVLDLRAAVSTYQDRGLLGLALDPGFPLVPYVYVLYTYDAPPGQLAPIWNDTCGGPGQPDPVGKGGGCVVSGRLARYTLMGGALIDETVLIQDEWYQQYPSHSVGDLAFGPDGMLYASAGEGASYQYPDDGSADMISGLSPNPGDPIGDGGRFRALDLLTPGDPVGLSGAILRLDPTTGAAAAGNPLSGGGARIIAFGLRNPFRFTFRPGTRELWLGDVGLDTYEEIDRVRDVSDGVVENFGWPCFEGVSYSSSFASNPLCDQLLHNALPPGTPGSLRLPHYLYFHGQAPGFMASPDPCRNGTSSALVGMTFYAGSSYPARLHGALFFGDFSVGCLYAMLPDASGVPDPANVEVVARGLPSIVSYESGPGGDLYYVSISTGEIHQLRYVDHAPTAVATADVTVGTSPLVVQLDGTSSIDPDGEPLTYAWDLDDDGEFEDSTDPAPQWTFGSGLHHARLRVTDPDGQSDVSAPIAITVDDQPPVVTIDAPLGTHVWRSGETINVAGSALDPEEGSLGPARLHWQITLFHCPGGGCHPHPFTSFDGESGSFVAAPDGYPAHFEITLTATDAIGLTAHATVTIEAAQTEVTFTSEPANIELRVGDELLTAPTTLGEVPGVTLELQAPETVDVDDHTYTFAGWSDGLPRVHDILVGDADATYHAAYTTPGGQTCMDCPDPATHGGCSAAGGASGFVVGLALLGLRRRRAITGAERRARPSAGPWPTPPPGPGRRSRRSCPG